MKPDVDILVVGGGLNGCTLALALAGTGPSVALVDALEVENRADPVFDGRGYSLALASKRMLETLGIWARVAEQSQPILDIVVSDGRAGEGASPLFVHFDHTEIEEGPMGHMLEDRFLRCALLDAVDEAPGITHISGTSVLNHTVETGFVSAALSTGQTLTARLIIGCDGRNSSVAQRAGIRRNGWGYNQTGLVCAVEHEKPHNGCAHQFFMPSGPLAILPLPGNRSSIVWTEAKERADHLQTADDSEFLDALKPCFGDFLGDIRLAGQRFSYPLKLTVAESFVADRLALVGDAAHGLHPIAGQGLNMGLRDIAALAEVVAEAARRGEDIGNILILNRYQQWRRFDTATMSVATDSINKLFSNDNPVIRLARDIGLGAVNAMPSARRGFIRQAAGLSGDVPKLLQGRAI